MPPVVDVIRAKEKQKASQWKTWANVLSGPTLWFSPGQLHSRDIMREKDLQMGCDPCDFVQCFFTLFFFFCFCFCFVLGFFCHCCFLGGVYLYHGMWNAKISVPQDFLNGSGGGLKHYCKVSYVSWSWWRTTGEDGAALGYSATVSFLHEEMSWSDFLSTSTKNPLFSRPQPA